MNPMLYPIEIDDRTQMVDKTSYYFHAKRTILLTGEINDQVAEEVAMAILYLGGKSEDDITLVINSPGGSVTAGMAVFDAMNRVSCDVITFANGVAASMGAFLLAAGTPGKRYASPTAEVMIHQPLGGISGQATDITVAAAHIQAVKHRMAELMAGFCGKTQEVLLQDMERDNWFPAQNAMEYGLVDHVDYPNTI